jgi:hypothetical protein
MKVEGKIYIWSNEKKKRQISFHKEEKEKEITITAKIIDEDNSSE